MPGEPVEIEHLEPVADGEMHRRQGRSVEAGVGKVLLAYAPEEVQREALGQLTRITPYTLTQPGLLRAQLSRVRTDGYATTTEEMSLGACSVAYRSPGPKRWSALWGSW
jgi:DNA-binding IclR family transcriptional regulator